LLGVDSDFEVRLSYTTALGEQITKVNKATWKADLQMYTVKFTRIPTNAIVVVTAIGYSGAIGTGYFTAGLIGEVKIAMRDVIQPTAAKNLAFENGLTGWITNGPPESLALVAHDEAAGTAQEDTYDIGGRKLQGNNDLVVKASGDSFETTAYHSFTVSTSTVGLRYRFVTEKDVENPFFPGTANDWYRVTIRSSGTDTVTTETGSILGLGPEAFDAAGSTTWRFVGLSGCSGTVEVDITVGQFTGSDLPSSVVVDVVTEVA
jgi:hypothetical protein